MSERVSERQQAIVIVGHMNPAIHHPGWYQSVGLLSEDEKSTAFQHTLSVLPELAQFQLGDIELLCLPDRWQVTAPSASGQRILALAKQTFERLNDTPVRAYGLNNNFTVQSGVSDVAARLSELSLMMPLGLQPFGRPSSATITLRYQSRGCVRQVVIAPSNKDARSVSIMNNAHYEAPATTGHFDLDKLLDEGWSEASSHAEAIVGAISTALG